MEDLSLNSSNAVLATFAAVMSVVITYIVFELSHKASEKNRIEDYLNQMINYSIEYPYLESPKFIAEWSKNRNSSNDRYLRYDSYCILVFNFLERMCRYYSFDRKKIEDYVHIREIVRTHQKWWNDPSQIENNLEGYPVKFRTFIAEYLV